MALRMVEMVLPDDKGRSVEELLEDFTILGAWQQPLENNRILARVLVRSEATEAVIEKLSGGLAPGDECRAWIMNVAATLPEPEEEEEDQAEEGDEEREEADEKSHEDRIAVIEIVETLRTGGEFSKTFVLTTFLATVVACVGLVKDSVAVVVGAMVIAPLLAPTMGISLGTTLGDTDVIRDGSRNTIFGCFFTLGVSALFGFPFDFALDSSVLVSRTSVDLLDMAAALAAGSAGALAYTSGIAGAVVGVMVAVALLPPLAAAGLFLGAGEYGNAGAAFLLYIVNITCMILAGVITFWAQGVRPSKHWEEARARKMVFRALGFALISVALLVAAILVLDGTIPIDWITRE
jgi:uncharacterized hydrophobic protein (TIGR00341 family)